MILKLPEWYQVSTLQKPDVATLENRSAEIIKISKSKQIDWMMNCIRLFLDKPIPTEDFVIELTNIFLKTDPLFPQKNNTLEFSFSWCNSTWYIISAKGKERICLAMAVKSALFQLTGRNLINIDIIESIKQFLVDEAIRIREEVETMNVPNFLIDFNLPDNLLPTLANKFVSVNDQFKNISVAYNDIVKWVNRKHEIFKEESNVHWWIFRGFSNDSNMPMKNINSLVAPILLGKELSDLVNIFPGPVASEQFLKKILADNFPKGEKDLIFKDAINKTDLLFRENRIKKLQPFLGNICPIMFAFSKSIETEDDTSWISSYEKSTKLKAGAKINADTLAYQSFLENLLTKTLQRQLK